MEHGHGGVHVEKGALEEIGEKQVPFALAFFGFFALCILSLSSLDLLPEGTQSVQASSTAEVLLGNPELPLRIDAPSIGLDVSVSNPASTDISVLDAALLSGAVRYPASARLGEEGTVLLFGHSSYLPVVRNQAYKAFDDIQDLHKGEIIRLYSAGKEYHYRVTGVEKKSAAGDDIVPLQGNGAHLALVTCDSFGKKTDRFVVMADLVGTYSLVN